jgi:hypothetical protein
MEEIVRSFKFAQSMPKANAVSERTYVLFKCGSAACRVFDARLAGDAEALTEAEDELLLTNGYEYYVHCRRLIEEAVEKALGWR